MSIQRRCFSVFSPLRAATSVFESRRLDWWSDPKMRPLRAMNQLRVPLIRDNLLAGKPITTDKPLADVRLIDVGCGGGLLAEPLARLGAKVTGIDTSEESINAAKDHLRECSSCLQKNLQYSLSSVEEFATRKDSETFDAIVASEVVEHIHDIESFVQNCAKILKPNGLMFITTINQTMTAYIIDILLAEKVFQLLPQGTHQYEMFVPPTSLSLLLEENNFTIKSIQGMVYNPLSTRWSWCRITSNNYALVAFKNSENRARVSAQEESSNPK